MDINYEKCDIPQRFETEICRSFGHQTVNKCANLLKSLKQEQNDINKCDLMNNLIKNLLLDNNEEDIKNCFVNVRHDLTVNDFQWAVEMYNQCNSLLGFANKLRIMFIQEMQDCMDSGKDFYGVTVTKEIMDYVNSDPYMFYGIPEENHIIARAIPCNITEYLNSGTDNKKQYYMCHCQYAKESIQNNERVSPLLCYCSLGHTMVLWEAVLSRKLKGKVLKSALKGDNECLFEIEI